MPKRRCKKAVAKKPASKSNDAAEEEAGVENNEEVAFQDLEVKRQSNAIKALRDVEIEHLLTMLHLLRSYFSEEQLQDPVMQVFKENLTNLSIERNGKNGHYEVQWKDNDGNLSTNQVDENIHATLLRQLSLKYSDCSAAIPSLPGYQLSNKAGETTLSEADLMQIKDYVLDEQFNSHLFQMQDVFRTPCVSSQRLSVGTTPKTLRLPKPGEMLLSVHGSPLGVYNEDNMEAIHESGEG